MLCGSACSMSLHAIACKHGSACEKCDGYDGMLQASHVGHNALQLLERLGSPCLIIGATNMTHDIAFHIHDPSYPKELCSEGIVASYDPPVLPSQPVTDHADTPIDASRNDHLTSFAFTNSHSAVLARVFALSFGACAFYLHFLPLSWTHAADCLRSPFAWIEFAASPSATRL